MENSENYKIKQIPVENVKSGDYVLSLNETSGKVEPAKVNALLDMGYKPIYQLITEDGSEINTTAEHLYLVKLYSEEECSKYEGDVWNKEYGKFDGNSCTRWISVDGLGEGDYIAVSGVEKENYAIEAMDSIVNLSPYSVIKLPSKSSGFIFSSMFENEESNHSGLSCGIFSQTTEKIFSFGKCSELEKSSSLVIRTLCSDFENAASLPLVSPFGFEIMSNPCCLRNFSSLNFTFSSLRNLTEGDAELDIIFTPHEISSILESCSDVLFGQRRIVFNDFFDRDPSLKHFKHLPDHDPSAFECGLSMTDFSICNNIIINFDSHEKESSLDYLKLSAPDFNFEKIVSINILEPQ